MCVFVCALVYFYFIRELQCFHITLFCLFSFILLFNQKILDKLFIHTNKRQHTTASSRPLSHPPAVSNDCRVISHLLSIFFPYTFRCACVCVCVLVRMLIAQSQFKNHKQTTKTNAMLNLLKRRQLDNLADGCCIICISGINNNNDEKFPFATEEN